MRQMAPSLETPGRFSLRLDVYSPPQVLQIDGRLYHLVLAFLTAETLQMAGPLCSTDITPFHRCRVGGGALDCSRAGLRPPLSWVEDWRAGFGRDASRPRHVSSSLHVARSVQICRVGPGSFTPSRSQIRT